MDNRKQAVNRNFAKNTIVSFINSIFGKILAFVFIILVSRTLGAGIYGVYVYVIGLLEMVQIIIVMGLPNGFLYFLSRNDITRQQKKSIFTKFTIIVMAAASVIIAIIYMAFPAVCRLLSINQEYWHALKLLLPSLILISVNLLLYSALRAFSKIKIATLQHFVLQHLLKIIAFLALIYIFKRNSVESIVFAYYCGLLGTTIVYLYNIFKVDLVGKPIKNYEYKSVMLFSLPLMFAGIVETFSRNIDKYMIGNLLTSAEVGIYRIAVQFGTVSILALTSVNLVFAPIISNLFHDGKIDQVKKLYNRSTKIILSINLLIFSIFLAYSRQIMLVAGSEFAVGGIVLILVSCGQVVNAAVGSAGYMNSMTGNPKVQLIGGASALILNIILNYFLIPIMGIFGAAIATMTALMIRNVIYLIYLYKRTKIHPYDVSFLYIAAVWIVSTGALLFVSRYFNIDNVVELIISVIIFGVVFTYLIYMLVLKKREREFIVSIFKQKN